VGCGLVLAVEAGRVTDVRPQADHPASDGQLCAKGWNPEKFLHDPARLTTPLVRRRDLLEPASWEDALEAAVGGLRAALRQAGPDAVGVISSARATNEDNFAAMRFARAVLGTNNVDHCAHVCHAPSVAGLWRARLRA
jgi:formate dehydrogenase major subunit